ncbi:hypothetical protein [Cerasicoccus frondis]|uniref:hypothetical protein n=1 Tax=Cerasicoccus frondis TaxID=490090 RepID=UPI002852877F|nr:hypothetical protein [Cerasicoccus frondis]
MSDSIQSPKPSVKLYVTQKRMSVNMGIMRGKSAYEVAVQNGFVGSEVDWLASLEGSGGGGGGADELNNIGVTGFTAGYILIINGGGTGVGQVQTLGQDKINGLVAALAAKQSAHVNLTALAGLAGEANKLAYFTGTGAMTKADITAFGRTLIALADAEAGRTALEAAKNTVITEYLQGTELTSAASIAWDLSTGVKKELTLSHNADIVLSNWTGNMSGSIDATQHDTVQYGISSITAAGLTPVQMGHISLEDISSLPTGSAFTISIQIVTGKGELRYAIISEG